MLNDLGNTQYYMLVGNKLTLHPDYDEDYPLGYKYRDIKYGVVPRRRRQAPATTIVGRISFPIRYLCILACYTYWTRLMSELGAAVDDTAAIADATPCGGGAKGEFGLDVLEDGFTLSQFGNQ